MLDQGFAELLSTFVPRARQPITDDLRLRDAGLDSLHSIDLLLAIEEKYDIEFPAHLLTDATFETAGSLWSSVAKILASAAAGTRAVDRHHG